MAAAADPTAALLIIGDEVLSAKVRDENTPYILAALRKHGVRVVEVRVVSDDEDRIGEALLALRGRAGVVITTGGIGPTHDDKTISAVARALGKKVVHDPTMKRLIEDRFGDRTSPARLRLAEVPEGAGVRLVEGATPLIRIDDVFILPGVPFLAQRLVDALAPEIAGPPFANDVVWLNVPETRIAAHLTTVQGNNPTVAIGSYPVCIDDTWLVKITVDGRDPARVAATMQQIRAGLDPEWITAAPRLAFP